jgi:hypothetical protein
VKKKIGAVGAGLLSIPHTEEFSIAAAVLDVKVQLQRFQLNGQRVPQSCRHICIMNHLYHLVGNNGLYRLLSPSVDFWRNEAT